MNEWMIEWKNEWMNEQKNERMTKMGVKQPLDSAERLRTGTNKLARFVYENEQKWGREGVGGKKLEWAVEFNH